MTIKDKFGLLLITGVIVTLSNANLSNAQEKGDQPPAAKAVRDYLVQQVDVMISNNTTLNAQAEALNRMQRYAYAAAEKAKPDNADSIQAAVVAYVGLQEIANAVTQRRDEQGRHVQMVGGLFKTVEAGQTQGTLPPGTVKPDDQKALEAAKDILKKLDKVLKDAANAQDLVNSMKDKGMKLPPVVDAIARGETPTGPVVVGEYLPNETTTGTASGFIVIRNFAGQKASGKLTIVRTNNEGTLEPEGDQFPEFGPNETRRFTFTVTPNPGKTLTYRYVFQAGTFK